MSADRDRWREHAMWKGAEGVREQQGGELRGNTNNVRGVELLK